MYFRNSIFVVLFVVGCLTHCFAQNQAQQKPKLIAGVSVEGTAFVDEQTIINLSGLRVGDELSLRNDKIPQAVRHIYSRKQFSDVKIVVEKETSLGLFLRIDVVEFPRYSFSVISGNDKISTSSINTEINKVKGDIFSPYDEYLAKKAVVKLYEKEGLMFASVKTSIEQTDTANYIKLLVTIDEGAEFNVSSIVVNGNEKISDGDLLSSLENTKTKTWYEFWKSSKFDKVKFDEDKENLVKYYKSKGFLDAELIKDSLTYNRENETVDIIFEVVEGNQIFLRDIKFEGNTVYPSDFLVKRLDVPKGLPVDLDRLNKNLNQNEESTDIRSLYSDNGYLTALTQLDLQRVAKDSVDAVIQIFERERFTVRRVEISGNTKTKDRVVRRELYARPGDYFSRAAVVRSIKNLGVLNYFNPEKLGRDDKLIKPVPGKQTEVDLNFSVEERSTDVLNASVGFAGTTIGLTGSIGVTFNNFDISDPLRGGGGQIFSFNWDFGQISGYNRFQISFTEPWLWGSPTTVGFNLYRNTFLQQVSTGFTGNVGRRLRFPDDYFRGDWSLTMQSQSFNAQDASNSVSTFDEVSISQTISRNSFDNLIFPTQGSRFAYTTRLSFGALGLGNVDYFSNDFTGEFINPLLSVDGMNKLVLYMSTEARSITGINDLYVSPYSRFAIGGNGIGQINTTPLRGYPDGRVGGVGDASGFQRNQFIFRQVAEMRFALSLNPMPIYLTAFAEAGNGWATMSEIDPFTLKRSAGFGMRILLNPIGLIGFDYGYRFDKPDGNLSGEDALANQWKFHFQFGR